MNSDLPSQYLEIGYPVSPEANDMAYEGSPRVNLWWFFSVISNLDQIDQSSDNDQCQYQRWQNLKAA